MQFTHKAIPGKAGLALALFALGGMTTAARADVITFDDLPNSSSGGDGIPSPYHGFTWNNFYHLTTPIFGDNPSGYQPGTVSGTNVAYNGYGDPASFVDSGSTFTLNSAYLTAAWHDGLSIQITGLDNGNSLFTKTVGVSATSPTLVNFNWSGINEVDFSSSGGTPHPGYDPNGGSTQFALDSLKINSAPVPEASTTVSFGLLLALGLGGLAVSARRRKASSAE